MAQIGRRLWSEIYTETLRRIGGVQYANFQSRLQYWIWESYLKLCLTYNQLELQDEVEKALNAGQSSVEIPTGCYAVMSVAEVDSTHQIVQVVQNKNDVIRQGLWVPFPGQPQNYSRSGHLGARIQFDRAADVDRVYRVCIYLFPDAPDFGAAAGAPFSLPQTSPLWDQAIMDAAIVRAGASVAAPEVAGAAEAALQAFLAEQIQSPLNDLPPGDLPNTPKSDLPRGGAQG